MKVDIKKELMNATGGILFIVVFYSIVSYFNLSPPYIWGILMILMMGKMIYEKAFTLKKLVYSSIYLAVFLWIIAFITGFGGIWVYIVLLIICGVLLFNRRHKYIHVKHTIEEMIWGKPLKDFNKETPIPKIKISLKK